MVLDRRDKIWYNISLMSRLFTLFLVLLAFTCDASWYWPFGSDEEEVEPPRISELMEPASLLIDKASDYADEGKIEEAIAEYRKALMELDRIELENPERAQSQEFATLRNKRAYVNSHIDTLLLEEVTKNAARVAITDTTELEKLYERRKAQERAAKEEAKKRKSAKKNRSEAAKVDEALRDLDSSKKEALDDKNDKKSGKDASSKDSKDGKQEEEEDPKTQSRAAQLAFIVEALQSGNLASARENIDELLKEKPNDDAALNLRARLEMLEGDSDKAENTLYQCILSNPRSHYAYYNMARVIISARGRQGRKSAAQYYKMGREIGGPVDEGIEEALK